ncbi:MAG: hypothetical protein PHN63_06635, partial [Candidatus Omnitrophica bacterium]|nr:hypothetical protein [Candidatus Omnitrophota bacterium]
MLYLTTEPSSEQEEEVLDRAGENKIRGVIHQVLAERPYFIDRPEMLSIYLDEKYPEVSTRMGENRLQYLEKVISDFVVNRNKDMSGAAAAEDEGSASTGTLPPVTLDDRMIESRKHLVWGDRYLSQKLYLLAKEEYDLARVTSNDIRDDSDTIPAIVDETIEEALAGINNCDTNIKQSIEAAAVRRKLDDLLVGLINQKIVIARKWWVENLGKDPDSKDFKRLWESLIAYSESVIEKYASTGRQIGRRELGQQTIEATNIARDIISEFMQEFQAELVSMGYPDVVPAEDNAEEELSRLVRQAKRDDAAQMPRKHEEKKAEKQKEKKEEAAARVTETPERDTLSDYLFDNMPEDEYKREMARYADPGLSSVDLLHKLVEESNWALATALAIRIEKSGMLKNMPRYDQGTFKLDKKTLMAIKEQGIDRWCERIRDALRKYRPTIMKMYDNLGNLTVEQKRLLYDEVYKIDRCHLVIWRLSSIVAKERVPLFNGSHITALMKALPKLDLNPLGFRLNWTTREKALESLRYVFTREVPDIVDRYYRLDELKSDERELLKRDIYERTTQGAFNVWGLAMAIDKDKVDYFNGSYKNVLIEFFPRLNLDPLGFELDWVTEEGGIASVRFILSREVPDIVERYDMVDKLSAYEIEKLREDIYTRLDHKRLNVWGLNTIFNRQWTPYFNGSYITALTKVFPRIELNPLGFKLKWTTRDDGIESVRYVLSKEASGIMRRYEAIDTLTEEEVGELREDICAISSAHFLAWKINCACYKGLAPYFGGSYLNVLLAVFDNPRLGLTKEMIIEYRKAHTKRIFKWEDEETGKANVFGAIEKNRPDIIERYRQLGSLTPAQIEMLKDDIYKIGLRHFKIWGLSAVSDKATAPYFEGSFINALIAIFPELELNPLGFGFLDWSTRERAEESIRFVMRREIPDIMERYERLAELTPGEREKLRGDIYRRIRQKQMIAWGLESVLKADNVPYFSGRYLDAVFAIFKDLELNPLGFKLTWKTKDDAIRSIRYVLERERPDILERYDRINSFTQLEAEELRQ